MIRSFVSCGPKLGNITKLLLLNIFFNSCTSLRGIVGSLLILLPQALSNFDAEQFCARFQQLDLLIEFLPLPLPGSIFGFVFDPQEWLKREYNPFGKFSPSKLV